MVILRFIIRLLVPLTYRIVIHEALEKHKRDCVGFETAKDDYVISLNIQRLLVTKEDLHKYWK